MNDDVVKRIRNRIYDPGAWNELLDEAANTIETAQDALREALKAMQAANGKLPHGDKYSNVAVRLTGAIHTTRQALKSIKDG